MLVTLARGSYISIALIICSSKSSSSISVLSANNNEFKFPPNLGRKGFSLKFVSNKFLTACFTAAASVFLNTSPDGFAANDKSMS